MFTDRYMKSRFTGIAITTLLLTATRPAMAQPGWVLSQQKVSDTQGGFTGILDNSDSFAASMTSLGDLDGDGVDDLAMGAWFDDDGGSNRGAVWVVFLNTDGTAKSHQKISDTHGGFTGLLDNADYFGSSVTSLGDLDGDDVGDMAVGAIGDDDGQSGAGAIWILYLNSDGTVKSHGKISATQGGFSGLVTSGDAFGGSLASLGDLDGDGVGDLATGAFHDDDGGFDRGAVWILFLNSDGTVKLHQKISDTQGGFSGGLDNIDQFGFSVAFLGDLDGDGAGDIAVGAECDDDGGGDRGAVWVLFLDTDGTVKSHQKISDTEGGFTGSLDNGDEFGLSIAAPGDLDGDGVGDLGVGAVRDDDMGFDRGALWVLFLNTDGTVKSHQKISDTEGGFAGILDNSDFFGASVASVGDLDGDGLTDLAVGACLDDDGGGNRGALWVLFLDGDSGCPADLDGSGVIDVGDLVAVILAWGTAQGDVTGDGMTDVEDLVAVILYWGPCS
jgi:hypothetical protein